MNKAYQFLRPLAFLHVRGVTLSFYRSYAPLIVSCTFITIGYLLPFNPLIVGQGSLSDYLSGFFVSLPGFYIAALSAVVAFNGGDLDKEMNGVTALMFWNGDYAQQEISLRIFLSYLFSYLVIISFLGFFVCLFGNLVGDGLIKELTDVSAEKSDNLIYVLAGAYCFVVFFLAASVVTCTFLGLYFLAERVYQEN